jgi:hypothetical protein
MKKKHFFDGILKTTEEKSRIRIHNPVYGLEDPDPHAQHNTRESFIGQSSIQY